MGFGPWRFKSSHPHHWNQRPEAQAPAFLLPNGKVWCPGSTLLFHGISLHRNAHENLSAGCIFHLLLPIFWAVQHKGICEPQARKPLLFRFEGFITYVAKIDGRGIST